MRLKKRENRKNAFSIVELVIVLLILAILMAMGIGVGSKQLAKARIQETTSFLQTVDTNIEEAIMDMGFLTDVDLSTNEAEIEAYLNEMEDIYLPCNFDFTTLTAIGPVGDYLGFSINLSIVQDSWNLPYRLFYMYDETTETYRITIASGGPNSTFSSAAATAYITASADDTWEDDIVVVMISRNR